MITAYILIQAEAGKAGIAAGPYDVIARAGALDLDELAKLVTARVRALDGVTWTMSCPVVHL